MTTGAYPFLDIAVRDGVRDGFTRGDSLAILTTDLDSILWANGAGAALFGHDSVETAIGAGSGLPVHARRQISALRGYPLLATAMPVMVRMVSGLHSRLIALHVQGIRMPGGEAAVLLSQPKPAGADQAETALSGLAGEGQHAALIAANGKVAAATPGYSGLGIEDETIAALIEDVAHESDRLVKRLVPSAHGLIPAGFARMADDPAVHLLLAVEPLTDSEGVADGPSGEIATETPEVSPEDDEAVLSETPRSVAELVGMAFGGPGVRATAEPGRPRDHGQDSRSMAGRNDNRSERLPRHDDWYFDENGEVVPSVSGAPNLEDEASADEIWQATASEAEHEEPETGSSVDKVSETETTGMTEESGAADRHDATDGQDPRTISASEQAPVRFVWRTDADGRFTALSQEFIDAIGPAARDVIGASFAEVATRLDLDPDGEIAGLLSRRDTWSGRSVRWPLEGTDLCVPVDLAALPVYDRDRVFQGFRGFGVARLAEATPNPAQAGPADVPGLPLEDEAVAGDQGSADNASVSAALPGLEDTDPFHGEAPALEIAESPKRRTTDKIISLAEHREKPSDRRLSASERQAFRAIGETLKSAGIDDDNDDVEDEADVFAAPPGEEAAKPAVPAINAWSLAPHQSQPDDAVAEPGADADPGAEAMVTDAPASVAANDEGSDAMAALLTDDRETGDGFDAAPGNAAADEVETGEAYLQADDAADGDEDLLASAFVEGIGTRSRPDNASRSLEHGEPVEMPRFGSPDDEAYDLEPPEALFDTTDGDGQAHLTATSSVQDADAIVSADAPADALSDDEAGLVPPLETGALAATEYLEESTTAKGHEDILMDADEAIRLHVPVEGEPASAEEDEASADDECFAEDTETDAAHDDAERAGDMPPRGFRFQAGDLSPSFLARLPMALIVTRGDHIAYANSAFLTLSGHESLAQMEAAGGLDILFADSNGEPGTHQMLRMAGGDIRPVKTHMQSVMWHGGKALMLAFTPQDDEGPGTSVAALTEADATAEASGERAPHVNAFLADGTPEQLRATVNQLNTILDTATDGVVLIDNGGTVRALNRSAQALFGFENDAVSGKPFTHLFAVESQRAARDYLQGLADNGVASVLNDGREVIGREAKGRFIPLFMTIGRLPREGGFCAVMRDITQWKRAEDELTEARRQAETASVQKTEFLARVSHEIRTPLNAIIGFSELMIGERFGPVGNERYKDYLRDINRSGNHVLDLVNDLLDISKIEAGQQELSYEAVALNDALTEAVAIMQPQANRERVIIRSSFASGLPDVVADLRSIKQIALNLLSNAVKFTPPGGQVIVSTVYEPTGEVVMRVRDTGIGMSDADVEHALKPFKQINTMHRTRGDGTGLGLPLTKAMVEANRAVFSINSKPGEGTMVQVTFPAPRVLADH